MAKVDAKKVLSPLYIKWGEESTLGVPIVDEQHKGVVTIINSLYFYLQIGRGDEIIKPTLMMLKQYVRVHFETEEAVMELAGYPEIDEHKELHRQLIRKTNSLSLSLQDGDDPRKMLVFLRDWWLDHINKEDKKIGDFLKKTGKIPV